MKEYMNLVTLPGARKTPKKRITAILELLVEGKGAEKGEAFTEGEEEEASDTEDKDIKVQLDLKGAETSGAKKTPVGRGKGEQEHLLERRGRGTGSGTGPQEKAIDISLD